MTPEYKPGAFDAETGMVRVGVQLTMWFPVIPVPILTEIGISSAVRSKEVSETTPPDLASTPDE